MEGKTNTETSDEQQQPIEEQQGEEKHKEEGEIELTPEFIATHMPDMYLDEDGNMRKFRKTQDVSERGWTMWAYEWGQYFYLSVTNPFVGTHKKNEDDQEAKEQV